MLARFSAFRHSALALNHHLRRAMSASNGVPKPQDRSNLVPFSSRLKEGRALAEDVWSIYKFRDSLKNTPHFLILSQRR